MGSATGAAELEISMAKKPKYEVEKQETRATESGFCWQIWFHSSFVVFWTEDAAKEACEAFNMHADLAKMKRRAKDLAAALEFFNED